mgnify:CR=1 FL=1|jgi:uncharacterized protein (TIGR02118 family)
MVKMIVCLRRLPHLSREEFQRYWREVHGPLVAKHAEALRMRRYIQAHTVPGPLLEALQRRRGFGEPFDGVAEVWFDSLEDISAPMQTPEGREAMRQIMEDEKNFLDVARSVAIITEEHSILEGTEAAK